MTNITWTALATAWLLLTTNGLAQSPQDDGGIERVKDRKEDKLVLCFTNDLWLDLPSGVELHNPSVGFKAYFFSDYRLGNGPVSIAWALGISADNVHSNAVPVRELKPDGSKGDLLLTPLPENHHYDKNKFVTTYAELPVELRLIVPGRNAFKLAVGFRLGFLLGDHTKIIDDAGKRKYYDFAHITVWRYGPSARLGVGKFAFTGFYSLTPLIEEGKGTQVTPVSLGLAFVPF